MSARRRSPPAWAAFALPAAIAVLIVGGFLVGGPLLGFLLAIVIAAVILVVAVRGGLPAPGRRLREAARRQLVPLALAVAGVLLVTLTTGTARIIGWVALSVAITLAIALVFLEVGYSEDRARARDARRDQTR